MSRSSIWLLAIAGIFSAGCDKSSDSPAAPSSSAASSAATPAPAATVADSDLVVPEDLAAEAEKTITKDNYKSELEATAADIEKP